MATDAARPNVIASLTDTQLQQTMLALGLACGRSHAAIKKAERREFYCFLFRTLQIEADFRGLPEAEAPFRVSGLKPSSLPVA